MNIPEEILERMLDKYVKNTYGADFKFRHQQKEVILDIVKTFFEGECNLYLLDAPTGSGKSIIAIITAGFLTEFKMRGYILASDLMLHKQYEKDLKWFNLQWGSITGVDNYTCAVNTEKFSLGECKINNISYEAAEALSCFGDCGYLVNRKKAIKSSVSILTYSYWLIQRNYVEGKMQDKGMGVPFPKRDFTFCDEAHKLSEIVQNHFSPRIDDKTFDKLDKLRAILSSHRIAPVKHTASRIKTVINSLFAEKDEKRIYVLLKEFEMQLSDFTKSASKISEYVTSKYPKGSQVPKDWKFYLGLADWVKDCHCKFEDYNHIISQVGIEMMIKNDQGNQVSFNCLDESYMMDRHFHMQSGFKLLMTATMGEPAVFLKTIGASNARYFKMDNNFDYEKSPIYFYPKRRMSLAQREKNLPWLQDKINEILSTHPEDSGIIHSGSYENTEKIFKSLTEENKKRVLIYQGSQEKNEVLARFLSEKGLVLMGPSILEGLDLSSEKSRFQIFVKVPFPSLGDKFVSVKMNYQPDWYDWKTTIAVLQGVGRSIRNENDWAITYFLDGCLTDLLKRRRASFPVEFQRRIKIAQDI